MGSNLNLQVILSLVDKLTGPMKQAAGSLDALSKEAKQAGEQLDRPVWADHAKTVGSISERTSEWAGAMGGVASAAEEAESALRSPAWVEHGRHVVQAAQAAHSYRSAIGGAGTAISALPSQPIKEQAEQVDKATGKVNEHTEAIKKGTKEVKEHAQAVGALSGAWEQAKQMGVAAIGAGTGLKLVHEMIKGGAERAHTDVAMGTAGLTPAESGEFDAAALRLTTKYPTFSQTEIKSKLTNLRAQTGSAEHSLMAIEPMLQGETAVRGENPDAAQGFDQLAVGLEVAGAFKDAGTLKKALDRIVRSVQVNKGTIRPEDYKLYYQHLGSFYGQKLDDEFQEGPLSLLLNEKGGDMAATGQLAFEREVYGSTVTGRRAEQLKKIGMLPDESKIHYGKGGHIKFLDPGAFRNWQLAVSNPDRWLNEELMPRIAGSGLSQEQQDLLFKSLWQTDVGMGFAALLVNQRSRSQRDTRLQRDAPGLAAFRTWLENDPGTASDAVKTQAGNIVSGAGAQLMPSLLGDARAAEGVLSWWNQLTAGHEAINTVGLSGIAAAGGTLAMQALKDIGPWAFAGRVASGVASLGGAYLFKEMLDVVDPKGNLGGLTTPIDNYFKRKFGWNPSNLFERGAPPEGAAYDPLYDPNSPGNMHRTLRSLHHAGYVTWSGKNGYRDTGELASEEDHESRRGWARSPGAQAAASEALDVFQMKAKEADAQLRALEQPVHPKVDASSIDALQQKLAGIVMMLGQINGGIGRLNSLNFTPRPGAPLHDGPEAR